MGDLPGLLDGLPAWPTIDFAEFGEVEVKPLGRIQQLTARFLGRNWVAIPHVTHHDDIDVSGSETLRKAWNEAHPDAKVTPIVPLITAIVATLKEFPHFNASLDAAGKTLIYKKYYNIGIAVDTPNGLLVPILKGCDIKTSSELTSELTAISVKARTKGLSMSEMSGGSMTISSLGHIGGTGFTPIINAPEVAILGVTKMQMRPFPDTNGAIGWRQMLPVSLSYDHRVINGADAARFVVALGQNLSAVDFA